MPREAELEVVDQLRQRLTLPLGIGLGILALEHPLVVDIEHVMDGQIQLGHRRRVFVGFCSGRPLCTDEKARGVFVITFLKKIAE